jgi:hypothetical protein
MSVASVALLFATMGGARTTDAHVLTHHGAHFGHIIAESEVVVSHAAHASHAGHHTAAATAVEDDPQQEQPAPIECTCVGPCQGGAAPNITQRTTYVVAALEVASAPQAPRKVRLVHHDATSHLLPLPNAPPALV